MNQKVVQATVEFKVAGKQVDAPTKLLKKSSSQPSFFSAIKIGWCSIKLNINQPTLQTSLLKPVAIKDFSSQYVLVGMFEFLFANVMPEHLKCC